MNHCITNDVTRKRLYKRLRNMIADHGHSQIDLTRATSRSASYVNERMSGRKDWSLSDCYSILDFYDVPAEELPVYFPKGGKAIA